MKVNEVILEAGILSGIKGAWKGFQQSKNLRKDFVSNDAFNQWIAYTKKLVSAGINLKDVNQYNTALNKWLGLWIGGKGANSYQGTLTNIDSNSVRQYIAQAIAKGKPPRVYNRPQPEQNVPAGFRLEVIHPETHGKYYKLSNGKWVNEIDQEIVDSTSINKLNSYADSAGKLVDVKPSIAQRFNNRRRT